MNFTFTLDDIKQTADKIFHESLNRKVWAIHGDMGVGKTTFIHALCENLGVHSAIGSPTYSIINEYKSDETGIIYHMDWYRLKDEEEALQAGVEDCIESGDLCLIDWPEKATALLPENCFHIYLSSIDTMIRQIHIT